MSPQGRTIHGLHCMPETHIHTRAHDSPMHIPALLAGAQMSLLVFCGCTAATCCQVCLYLSPSINLSLFGFLSISFSSECFTRNPLTCLYRFGMTVSGIRCLGACGVVQDDQFTDEIPNWLIIYYRGMCCIVMKLSAWKQKFSQGYIM